MRVPEPRSRFACGCGGHGPGCRKAHSGKAVMRLPADRAGRADSRHAEAPPAVHEVLRSPGRPLDPATRAFMEPRFGVDFAAVRVHTDARAQRLAATLSADAFTAGSDIFFGAGKWDPGSAPGRRLIAHELVHTVQQSRGASGIQRFVPCTRARLSLEECPRRKPGEVRRSRREPMSVLYLTSPVEGYLLANFAVGRSSLKSSVRKHPSWLRLINAMSSAGSQWALLGLSDCRGADALNTPLRQDRAEAVRAALPAAAAAHVVRASAVPLYHCITDNTTPIDRALNRSVLIRPERRSVAFPPDVMHGTRRVPKPKRQPTVDCSIAKQRQIAHAHPLAVAMVGKALNVLGGPRTPAVVALLKKYFNDASTSTYLHVIAGFRRTLSGLRSSVKIECENSGSLLYDKFCSSSRTDATIAYVRSIVGFRIHLCEAAFGRSDRYLAETLVHEFSHMFDFTDDEEYCARGCSASLSRWDAYDNADSYSGFAAEAYLTL